MRTLIVEKLPDEKGYQVELIEDGVLVLTLGSGSWPIDKLSIEGWLNLEGSEGSEEED